MAWLFDETNDVVTVADAARLTLPDANWSLGGWYYLSSNAGTVSKYLLSWGGYNATPSMNLIVYEASHGDANKVEWRLRSGAGTQKFLFPASTAPGATGVWHHVLAYRDGSTLGLDLDGTSLGTTTVGVFTTVDLATDLYIGARSDLESTRFFGGRLAEFFKLDRALSAREKSSLARGLSPSDLPGMGGSGSWHLPMHRGRYTELRGRLALTNSGSTGAPHAPVRLPWARSRSLFLMPASLAGATATFGATTDDAAFAASLTAGAPGASSATFAATTADATFSATAVAVIPGPVPRSWLLDEFLGTGSTELSTHSPEDGGDWSKHPNPGDAGTADAVLTGDGHLRGTAAAGIYTNDEAPPSAEYDLSGRVLCRSATGSVSIAGRLLTSELTGYHARRDATGWSFRYWVNNVLTIVDTWTDAAVAGNSEHYRLVLTDSAKVLYVDGVQRLTSADNGITGAGVVGVRFSGSATDSTGFHLDRLEAAAPIVATLSATTADATFAASATAGTPGESSATFAATTADATFAASVATVPPPSEATFAATTADATFAASAVASAPGEASAVLSATTEAATFAGSVEAVAPALATASFSATTANATFAASAESGPAPPSVATFAATTANATFAATVTTPEQGEAVGTLAATTDDSTFAASLGISAATAWRSVTMELDLADAAGAWATTEMD